MKNEKTYVVVPAFNEGPVIRSVVSELGQHFDAVVVVDDGSSDDTIAQLQGLPVVILAHCVNLGQGAALQSGITYALREGAEFIGSFDSDGQHAPHDLRKMFDVLYTGAADAVIGSRFLGTARNIPLMRRLTLRLAVSVFRITNRTRLTDVHNGLRAFNRRAALVLNITQNGMAHASEIIEQLIAGEMTIVEHPVTITYTEYSLKKGQKTMNAINVLLDLFISRFMK